METVFLELLNRSIAAGWLIFAVLLLRVLLKRASKGIRCLLWAFVAFRLVCPFSLESVFSLIPSEETLSPEMLYARTPAVDSGMPALDSAMNPFMSQSFAPVPEASVSPLQVAVFAASVIWAAGLAAMLVYAAVSCFRLRRRVGAAMRVDDNIWLCDQAASPFIFGFWKPRIYLPSDLDEGRMAYVLAHEKAHLKRRDYLWKPLGFLLLSVYWFNPLCWLAYWFFCRDMELACDERVVRTLDLQEKKAYSEALLSCSAGRRGLSACPLSFAEVGVKERVKNVLSYKKPAFWLTAAAVVLCAAAAVCLLTNPAGMTLSAFDEGISLEAVFGETACLWVGDGGAYRRLPSVEDVQLETIGNIRIRRRPLLNDPGKDRTPAHALVLQSETDAIPSASSALGGVYLCFNDGYTAFWLYDGDPPAHSYKVQNPEAVREIFDKLRTQVQAADTAAAPNFAATVLEVNGESLLVRPLDGSDEARSADKIWVSAGGMTESERAALTVGSLVRIFYDGLIAESYPAQIQTVYAIVNIDEYDGYPAAESIAVADIDGDGREETCCLGPGPTSGLFTFTFSAAEDGRPEYSTTFVLFLDVYPQFSFVETADGKLRVKGVTWGDTPQTYLYDIAVQDDNIVLSENGVPLTRW